MELFNKEGHLTDEGLRAVVDGTLDEMGRLEASEHLSFCDSCLVRYTELLADDTLLVPEMPLTPTVLARVRRRAVRVFFNRYTRVAAVAAFAVCPRAQPQNDLQPGALCVQHKGADVAVAGKIQLSFLLLMVDPEQVGGNQINAAGLHLAKLAVPVFTVVAHKMIFPHDRQPRAGVALKIAARHGNLLSLGVAAAKMQVPAQQGCGGGWCKCVVHKIPFTIRFSSLWQPFSARPRSAACRARSLSPRPSAPRASIRQQ